MTSLQVERTFKELACKQIELVPDGRDKFIVHTPFRFDDGDHFVIVLKATEGGWLLTDEGHTLMHLSYGGFKATQPRQLIINQALTAADAMERDGEITLEVLRDDFGAALFAFVQVLIRVAEVAKWTRLGCASVSAEPSGPAETARYRPTDEAGA